MNLELDDQTYKLFRDAVRRVLTGVDPQYSERALDLIRRYRRLVEFTEFDADIFIMRGIGTANRVAWDLINRFAALMHEQHLSISKQEARRKLMRAFHKLAMPFSGKYVEDLGVINPGNLLNSVLELEMGDQSRLTMPNDAISREVLGRLQKMRSDIDMGGRAITTWCPAYYSVGGRQSVMREHFAWILDVAFRHDQRFASLPDGHASH